MEENTFVPEEQNPQRENTMKETDKKCPECGGTMDYDPTTLGLLCPYCGHKQKIEQQPVVERAQELDLDSAEKTANCDWGSEKKTVICKSCGAETIYDSRDLSSECPYCGSNQVVEAADERTMAPGGVCPFKIDKQTATANFTKWIKKKWFCPSKAKKKAQPEAFNGIYLPYWTFDAQTLTDYRGEYGIEHTTTDSDGNTRTHTSWHKTSGTYSTFINDQAVLASTKHDANLLRQIEPYDTENNVAYKPEYIAGFAAEKYSLGILDGWTRAKEFIFRRLESEIKEEIKSNHHADDARVNNMNTIYSDVTYKYLLLPVWISSFRYKNKVFNFTVNGQTGKVGGKTPVSPLRVAIAIALGVALFALIYYLQHYNN